MPLLFVVTLFASASLLFMVQPMVGRMVLPLLGGSPAVWNACMVFFQALLLVGYLYADRVTTRLEPKKQWVVHCLVLMLPILAMTAAILLGSNHSPIAVAQSLAPGGNSDPILGVLGLLAVAIGIPFFVASTSAPLLQKWFALTGHPTSRDPYFLYAASNAGSLISLLGYPFLIEPNLGLTQQAWLFGIGFTALIGLILLCGRAAANPVGPPPTKTKLRKMQPSPVEQPIPPDDPEDPNAIKPTLARKLHWLALSFVPSSLMLGVTFYMTTDIASIPLLWVIPLALYLVTFIIAFGRVPAWFRLVIGNLAPVMILLLVFVIISGVTGDRVGLTLMLHLGTFFAAALMCHYELATDRPAPQYLTNYYLWISLGGVLGGIFNALLAPLVFPLAYEYQITLICACALVPSFVSETTSTHTKSGPITHVLHRLFPNGFKPRTFQLILDIVIPLIMAGFIWSIFKFAATEWFHDAVQWFGTLLVTDKTDTDTINSVSGKVRLVLIYALPIMLCFFFVDRPVRFALCVAVILIYNELRENREGVIHTERSFFGILKIERSGNDRLGHFRRLVHGTTLHGTQFIGNHWADQFQGLPMFSPWDSLVLNATQHLFVSSEQPLTYYHRSGPVGAMFRELNARPGGKTADFAMVGLGTGSVACYANPGEKLTFYEIDPSVIRLVEPGKYFTYLADAKKRGAAVDIVVGDARLRLQDRPENKYALLLVDAFSSDSIPVHLLTKEAVKLYTERLTDDGFFALHISNKFVDLEPVVAAIAADLGLTAFVWNDSVEKGWPGKTASSWVVLAKDPKNLGGLKQPVGELLLKYDPRSRSDRSVQMDRVIELEFGADAAKKVEDADKSDKDRDRKLDAVATELVAKHGPVAGTLVSMVKKTSRKEHLANAMVAEFGHAFRPIERTEGVKAWKDDYADVLQVMTIPEVQAVRRMFGMTTPVTGR